jgi:hypothetical protein
MGHDPDGWFIDYNIVQHGYVGDVQGSGGDLVFFSPGSRSTPSVGGTKSFNGTTYYIAVVERRDIGDKTPYLWIALLTKYPPPQPPIIWSAYNGNLFSGTFTINFGKTFTYADEAYEVYRTFDGTNFHYLTRIEQGPFVDYNVPPLTYVGYKIRTVDRYFRYSAFTAIVWSYAPWSRSDLNPILSPAGSGWDSFGHFSPFIAFDSDTYHLFASGCTTYVTGYQIGHWTISQSDFRQGNFSNLTADPANPILSPAGTGFMQNGVAESSLLRYGNYWWQYFTGYDNHNGGGMDAAGIGLAWAQSLNGPWTVVSNSVPLVDLGSPGQWDDYDVFGANAIVKNGEIKLYYSGGSSATNAWEIGLATGTSLYGPLTKHASNPIVSPSATGWDDHSINHPRLFDWENWLLFHYNGNDTPAPSLGAFQIGEGYTEDFTTVIKGPFNPCLGLLDGNEINLRIGHHLFRKPGTNEYFMVYSSADVTPTGIYINLARLWR